MVEKLTALIESLIIRTNWQLKCLLPFPFQQLTGKSA